MPIISGGGGGGAGSGAAVIQAIGPLTGTQATLDFTAGVSGYAALFLTAELRSTAVAQSDLATITFNGDSGAHYVTERLDGTAAVAAAAASTGNVSFPVPIVAASASAGECSSLLLFVPNAGGSTFAKHVLIQSGLNPTQVSTTLEVFGMLGVWRPTVKAGVSRITIGSNGHAWDVGSFAALYGYAL